MIGGFGARSTTGQMQARFMGPNQYQLAVKNLKTKQSQLTHAKKELKDHKRLMTVAHFSPEGYKKAVAKQKTLEKKVETLTKQVADLKRLLTVA